MRGILQTLFGTLLNREGRRWRGKAEVWGRCPRPEDDGTAIDKVCHMGICQRCRSYTMWNGGVGKRTWLHAMVIADGMEYCQVRLQYCEVPYAVLRPAIQVSVLHFHHPFWPVNLQPIPIMLILHVIVYCLQNSIREPLLAISIIPYCRIMLASVPYIHRRRLLVRPRNIVRSRPRLPEAA